MNTLLNEKNYPAHLTNLRTNWHPCKASFCLFVLISSKSFLVSVVSVFVVCLLFCT